MKQIPPNTPAPLFPQLLGAQAAGVEPQRVMEAAKLPPEQVDPRSERGVESSLKLWRAAVELTGDVALALHAAEAVPWGAYDVLDYIASNSETVFAGLEAVERYFAMTGSPVGIEVERKNDGSVARLPRMGATADPDMRRYEAEFTMACMVLRFRHTTEPFEPRVFRTSYAAPAYTDEYTRIFACPIDWATGADELELDEETTTRRLPGADMRLRKVLERAASEMARQLAPRGETTSKVRRVLHEQIQGCNPRLETVAKKLALSPRSLHRHLAGEGTSFQAELDAVRAELGTRYLVDPKLSLAEVAFLLGFSEVSSFSRAFRRWQGVSPADWRAQRTST